jgi:mono/diheme cytochrome c family protein
MRILKPRQSRQARNAESVLGDPPIQAQIYGTWLTWIAVGAIVTGLLFVFTIFNNDKVLPAALARADHNSYSQIPEQTRLQYAKEGQALFTTNCGACHASGGYQATGIGPRLDRSANAYDMGYVRALVRWGYNPMPTFTTAALPDASLYKITVYLQLIHQHSQAELTTLLK